MVAGIEVAGPGVKVEVVASAVDGGTRTVVDGPAEVGLGLGGEVLFAAEGTVETDATECEILAPRFDL